MIAAAPSGPLVTGATPRTFALYQLFLGDTDRSGVASTTAWKNFGYNMIILLAALQAAIADNNPRWASSSDAVGALLAEDVVYIDLRGAVAQGREAALASMDQGTRVIWERG